METIRAGAACEPFAEASASSDASASCYGFTEDVRVLAMVIAELKFSEVQRKILLRNMVKASHDAALQQAPERFNIIGMNLAANVFALPVSHNCMFRDKSIAGMLIGSDQVNILTNGFADKTVKCGCISVFDYLADMLYPETRLSVVSAYLVQIVRVTFLSHVSHRVGRGDTVIRMYQIFPPQKQALTPVLSSMFEGTELLIVRTPPQD